MQRDDKLNLDRAYYWLTFSGMTARKLHVILSHYSPLEIYDRIEDTDFQHVIGEKHAFALLNAKKDGFLNRKLEEIVRSDLKIITIANAKYPEKLKQKEVSPPLVLYYQGDIAAVNAPCVAIVGTRACSDYGRQAAEAFARDLASAGVTVVSGLATGIDSYAHAAALINGKTAAVLGGGHKQISSFSAILKDKILQNGGIIISEYPPDFSPTKYTFPERNRIISGLCSGVVVIEARKKSGSLITADYALEQGRELYALPGRVFDKKSEGTNLLIKEGNAALVFDANDVLQDLALFSAQKNTNSTFISMDFYEQTIYNLLQSESQGFDDLLQKSEMSAAELSVLLVGLEMKGAIKRLPSNNYVIER
jgi:DNA processing protein